MRKTMKQANRRKTMNNSDPRTRYLDYLESFGIAEAGDRVAELRDLDLGGVRFFAFDNGEGLRLKAAVTPSGVVTSGGHTGDDWYGFLSAMPDAMTASERIAWLETDASTPPHGLPIAPVLALAPDRRPTAPIDPAQWALVTPPRLFTQPDASVILVAWFLLVGAPVPQRWTVTGRAGKPCAIVYASALDLVAAEAGSVEAASSGAAKRARSVLARGTDSERWWAMRHIAETGSCAAIPDLAALLADSDAAPNLRLLAAGTLAQLADSTAVVPLVAALQVDPSPEVRRECAQAIGRIGGLGAIQPLADAASCEPDVIVRAEIVRALTAQGNPARPALAQIASDDHDASVRNLARAAFPEASQAR
jgi:hypothetical protein